MNIEIEYHNESYCKISTTREISLEISDHFSFYIEGYKFNPRYKHKQWDGKIRLYNLQTRTFPVGLLNTLQNWCNDRDYVFINDLKYRVVPVFQKQHVLNELKDIPLPEHFLLRDYQEASILDAIQHQRRIILSPTGSGKSLIAYMLIQYYLKSLDDKEKILLIVPTGTLVFQMYNDFKSYGMNVDSLCHMIVEGAEKETTKPIIISTWQSLQYLAKQQKNESLRKMYNPSYFHKFKMVIGDECHHFQADALKAICDCCINADIRFGMTGTLSGSKTNEMVLKGLFGEKHQVITTKNLMDNQTLSKLKLNSISITYPKEVKTYFKKNRPEYQEEMKYLLELKRRNEFISKLAISIKGNTLIIYKQLEHGKRIHDIIAPLLKNQNRNIYYFTGEISASKRDEIRKQIESETNCVILGTLGAISTGINIVKLHNIIFAAPSKSRIKVMQSIGRVLRKSNTKTNATLYDISDNISSGKYENYTWKHYKERLQMYIEEDFEYKLNTLDWS